MSQAFTNSIYEYSIFKDLERWEFIVFGFWAIAFSLYHNSFQLIKIFSEFY